MAEASNSAGGDGREPLTPEEAERLASQFTPVWEGEGAEADIDGGWGESAETATSAEPTSPARPPQPQPAAQGAAAQQSAPERQGATAPTAASSRQAKNTLLGMPSVAPRVAGPASQNAEPAPEAARPTASRAGAGPSPAPPMVAKKTMMGIAPVASQAVEGPPKAAAGPTRITTEPQNEAAREAEPAGAGPTQRGGAESTAGASMPAAVAAASAEPAQAGAGRAPSELTRPLAAATKTQPLAAATKTQRLVPAAEAPAAPVEPPAPRAPAESFDDELIFAPRTGTNRKIVYAVLGAAAAVLVVVGVRSLSDTEEAEPASEQIVPGPKVVAPAPAATQQPSPTRTATAAPEPPRPAPPEPPPEPVDQASREEPAPPAAAQAVKRARPIVAPASGPAKPRSRPVSGQSQPSQPPPPQPGAGAIVRETPF
jgi:hypothetical protein